MGRDASPKMRCDGQLLVTVAPTSLARLRAASGCHGVHLRRQGPTARLGRVLGLARTSSVPGRAARPWKGAGKGARLGVFRRAESCWRSRLCAHFQLLVLRRRDGVHFGFDEAWPLRSASPSSSLPKLLAVGQPGRSDASGALPATSDRHPTSSPATVRSAARCAERRWRTISELRTLGASLPSTMPGRRRMAQHAFPKFTLCVDGPRREVYGPG